VQLIEELQAIVGEAAAEDESKDAEMTNGHLGKAYLYT
jgi:hypothetical protein